MDSLEKGGFECAMSYMPTIYTMGDKGGLSKWTWPKRGVSSIVYIVNIIGIGVQALTGAMFE